ncbi:MAG: transporter substrate-binding domain-containing protein [Pseudomonadota bacterium]
MVQVLRALVWMASLAVGASAWAADVDVFGSDYSIPKAYVQNGENKGVLVDILKYVDERLPHHQFTVKLAPWSRAYKSAVDGEGGIVGISKTAEREVLFDYSESLYTDNVMIVVLAGKAFDFKGVADLHGKTIGIGRRGSYGDAFDNAHKAGLFRLEEDSGPDSRLRKLLAGRMDGGLFNGGTAGFLQVLQQDRELYAQRDKFEVLPVPLKIDPNYLAFAKGMHQQDLLNEVNKILRLGHANGDLARITGAGLSKAAGR